MHTLEYDLAIANTFTKKCQILDSRCKFTVIKLPFIIMLLLYSQVSVFRAIFLDCLNNSLIYLQSV